MFSLVLALAFSLTGFAHEHVRVPFSPAGQSELVKFQQIAKAQPEIAISFPGQSEFAYAQYLQARQVIQWVKADAATGTVTRWAFELTDETFRPLKISVTPVERGALNSHWISVARDFGSLRLRQDYAIRVVDGVPFALLAREQREGTNGLILVEVDKNDPRTIRVFTPKGLGQLKLDEQVVGEVVRMELDLNEMRFGVVTTAMIRYVHQVSLQGQVLKFQLMPARSVQLQRREVAAQQRVLPTTCTTILR